MIADDKVESRKVDCTVKSFTVKKRREDEELLDCNED